MNEQNNLNQNTFNATNNTGLDVNQNTNNGVYQNQDMQQNNNTTGIYATNNQTQNISNYQQLNQIPSVPLHNEKVNNILPKKSKKKIFIVLGIVIILIILIILFFIINKNDDNDTGKDANLVYQKESTYIVPIGDNYFAIENGIDTDGLYNTMVDCDGNIVVERKDNVTYIADNYFIENYNRKLISNNKEILQLYENSKNFYTYKDHIIYYVDKISEEFFIKAYDIKNKKELWSVKGFSPSILHNDIIVSKFGEEEKMQLITKNGKILAKDSENDRLYPTSVDRYIKVSNNNLVQIYDLNSKLISSLELSTSDTFENVLSIGLFIIKHNFDDGKYEYRIYNDNSKLVKTFTFDYKLLNYPYMSDTSLWVFLSTEGFNDDKKSIIISETYFGESIVLLSDGTIIDNGSTTYTHNGALTYMSSGDGKFSKATYASSVNKKSECMLINLENSKSLIVDNKICYEWLSESPNGKYLITNISYQNKNQGTSYIYDSNFNLVYKSSADSVFSYDDNNIIEIISDYIFVVNVFTGKKTKLNVKGKYHTNNSCGIVTTDSNSSYIYKTN